MAELQIAPAVEDDWQSIRQIFEEGIATGHSTFSARAPKSWEEWAKGKIPGCSLVAKLNHRVVGWVALESVSERPVYSGVAYINIYVARDVRGRGIGSRLLATVIDASEAAGIWTLEARIFPENHASLQLHRHHGFRDVGVRERIGLMELGPVRGEWRDVVLLERRSRRVGCRPA